MIEVIFSRISNLPAKLFSRTISLVCGLLLIVGFVLFPGSSVYPQNQVQKKIQGPGPTFHSFLTKDLTRLIPATTFSKNDRIYLYTIWTGLQGLHEIKVLWIRPDKKVQETVRIKEKAPANTPNYATWAWLSFKKGLLNLSSSEGKFTGAWKARLFLDGKLLKEYAFSIS